MLYENGGKIASDYEMMAYDLRADLKLIKSIVEESDLFYRSGSTSFGSRSVDRRLQQRRERARKAAEAGRLGGVANAKRMLDDRLAETKLERRGEAIEQKVGIEPFQQQKQQVKALIASAADRHAF